MTLDEIRKLIDAATPGPWWNELWDVHSSRVHICEAQTTGAEIEPAPVKDTFVFHEDGRVTTMGGSQLADISQEEAEANARFIAASRTLLPKLLAVAEAAGQWLEYHDTAMSTGSPDLEHLIPKRAAAREKTRAALAALEADGE